MPIEPSETRQVGGVVLRVLCRECLGCSCFPCGLGSVHRQGIYPRVLKSPTVEQQPIKGD